jgi:hypothetical protein
MYCGGGEEEKKRRKGRRGRGRERESKGQQRKYTSILHFLRKKNNDFSPLLTEEREGD